MALVQYCCCAISGCENCNHPPQLFVTVPPTQLQAIRGAKRTSQKDAPCLTGFDIDIYYVNRISYSAPPAGFTTIIVDWFRPFPSKATWAYTYISNGLRHVLTTFSTRKGYSETLKIIHQPYTAFHYMHSEHVEEAANATHAVFRLAVPVASQFAGRLVEDIRNGEATQFIRRNKEGNIQTLSIISYPSGIDPSETSTSSADHPVVLAPGHRDVVGNADSSIDVVSGKDTGVPTITVERPSHHPAHDHPIQSNTPSDVGIVKTGRPHPSGLASAEQSLPASQLPSESVANDAPSVENAGEGSLILSGPYSLPQLIRSDGPDAARSDGHGRPLDTVPKGVFTLLPPSFYYVGAHQEHQELNTHAHYTLPSTVVSSHHISGPAHHTNPHALPLPPIDPTTVKPGSLRSSGGLPSRPPTLPERPATTTTSTKATLSKPTAAVVPKGEEPQAQDKVKGPQGAGTKAGSKARTPDPDCGFASIAFPYSGVFSPPPPLAAVIQNDTAPSLERNGELVREVEDPTRGVAQVPGVGGPMRHPKTPSPATGPYAREEKAGSSRAHGSGLGNTGEGSHKGKGKGKVASEGKN